MLSSYHTMRELLMGAKTVVYRGCTADGKPVIIKRLRADADGPQERARLKQEYHYLARLRDLQAPHIFAVHTLYDHRDEIYFVGEDTGAEALSSWVRSEPLPLAECLSVGYQISQALAAVHRQRLIHCDVNSNNVVFNRSTGVAQLIDFELTEAWDEQQPGIEHAFEGTLAYMSPEQTRRTSLAVDHRTDLYSLGVTLYEALCGALPFDITEPDELVHAIVGEVPPSLALRAPNLPTPVVQIVERLMDKDPTRRYQSAAGVAHDLQACLNLLKANQPIDHLILGQHDYSDRLELTRQLFHRDEALAALSGAFEQVRSGGYGFAFVTGGPGIGKSALVAQARTHWLQHKALVGEGRHATDGPSIPFAAFRQAMAGVARALLMENTSGQQGWERRLRGAVGTIGKSVLDIVPEFAPLLGDVPELPPLGPQEAENRLLLALQRLLSALSGTRPLVLVLDNLQAVDSATIKLLASLKNQADSLAGVLFVGAFRDNEVGPQHSLSKLQTDLQGPRLHSIALPALRRADVESLLQTSTGASSQQVADLAGLLFAKTAGNPFFVRALVDMWWRQGLLTYDLSQRSWTWDLRAIQSAKVPEDVAVVMTTRLLELPDSCRTVLGIAALMGHGVALPPISEVLAQTVEQTTAALQPAVEQQVILPLTAAVLQFSHDRIRQAALSLIAPAELPKWHRAIAQNMLRRPASERSFAWVFKVTDHLNAAASALEASDATQRRELNATAAHHAERAMDYAGALVYLQTVETLLPADAAHERRAVHLRMAGNEFLAGSADAGMQRLEQLIRSSPSVKEEIEARQLACEALTAASRLELAVQQGLAALKLAGLTVNPKPNKGHIVLEIIRWQMAVRKHPADRLGTAEPISDPGLRQIANLLNALLAPTFFVAPDLWAWVNIRLGHMSIAHGTTASTPQIYGSLGAITAMEMNDYPTARKYFDAGMAILQRQPESARHLGCLIVSINCATDFVQTPPYTLGERYQEASNRALEAGDLLWAVLGACEDMQVLALVSLEKCIHEGTRYLQNLPPLHRDAGARMTFHAFMQMARCLRGQTESTTSLRSPDYDDAADEALAATSAPEPGTSARVNMRVILHTVAGDYVGAAQHGDVLLASNIYARSAEDRRVLMCYFLGLAFLAATPQKQALTKPRADFIARARKKLRVAGAQGPEYFGGLPEVLEANIAAQRGDRANALLHFETAARAMQTCPYPALVACALESAARFCEGAGLSVAASAYWTRCHAAYSQWGATVKCEVLEKQIPTLRPAQPTAGVSRTVRTHRGGSTSTSTSTGSHSSGLDLPTLSQAYDIIASEMEEGRLVQGLMEMIRRYAGATRVVYLSPDTNDKLVAVHDTSPTANGLPAGMIAFVERSLDTINIADVNDDADSRRDPYFRSAGVKCALCLPVRHRGRLASAVYMENDVTPRAFQSQRIVVVRLLAAQATLALENTRFNSQIDSELAQRMAEAGRAQRSTLEAQRRSAEEHMAGGFAHEMRNALSAARYALTAITQRRRSDRPTLLEELQDAIKQATPHGSDAGALAQGCVEQMGELLGSVEEGVNRGITVTAQILEYAQTGHLLINHSNSTISAVVDSIVRSLADKLTSERIALKMELEADLKASISQEHAHTILNNLIVNARDAIIDKNDGGSRTIVVRGRAEGERVLIEVQDSGVGIPDANRGKIFQPFFTTKGSRGTGLGLGLARRIANLYGGELDFQSSPDAGCTFCLTLPTGEEQPGSTADE